MYHALFVDSQANGFRGIAQEKLENFKYVAHLATLSSTSLVGRRTEEFVGVAAGDRPALNKILFSLAAPVIDSASIFTAEVLASIADAQVGVSQHVTRVIGEERAARVHALRQIAVYHDEISNKLTEAMNHHDTINAMEGRSFEIKAEIEAVLAGGFYKFHSIVRNTCHFTTANPVIMQEVTGTNRRRVNMGTYQIGLGLNSGSLTCQKHTNNMTVGGHWHPYVSDRGNICWGSSNETAQKMLSQREFSKVFQLLASLLVNYDNTTTPYMRLLDFENEEQRRDSRRALVPDAPICTVCNNPINGEDCGCIVCSNCELRYDETGEHGVDHCSCESCGGCNELFAPGTTCESCHYCDPCDRWYADGDSCDGNWCDRCDECTGNSSCGDHYCNGCHETVRSGEELVRQTPGSGLTRGNLRCPRCLHPSAPEDHISFRTDENGRVISQAVVEQPADSYGPWHFNTLTAFWERTVMPTDTPLAQFSTHSHADLPTFWSTPTGSEPTPTPQGDAF